MVEVARFVKAFDADKKTMESSYKIPKERSIFIKFRSEEAMKDALAQNAELHTFVYSSGEKITLKMGIAGGISKYVRIFDLPPEVTDTDIAAVMSRYGSVKRQIREKFPAELELDLYTGVRGIYIDVKKEIPSSLYFLNRRGRLFYEGIRQKCFLCKMEGHLKAECPQKRKNEAPIPVQGERVAPVIEEAIAPIATAAENPSYATALKSRKKKDVLEQPIINMVKLVSSRQAKGTTSASGEESVGLENTEDRFEGFMVDMETDNEMAKAVLKRQHSAEASGGGTDEEGFVRVTARSQSRKAKKNALELIATITKSPDTRGNASE